MDRDPNDTQVPGKPPELAVAPRPRWCAREVACEAILWFYGFSNAFHSFRLVLVDSECASPALGGTLRRPRASAHPRLTKVRHISVLAGQNITQNRKSMPVEKRMWFLLVLKKLVCTLSSCSRQARPWISR